MYKVMRSAALPVAENLDELYVEGWQLITIINVNGWFYSYFISTVTERDV